MIAPLTISHAACKGHAPENTMAGIHAAVTLGVDAIEIDVHASRDGVPVLIHDERVDRTTDGTGAVRDLTLDQLRRLDAGARSFDGRFAGERVPMLAEVLDLTRNACLLVIEVKQPGIVEHIAEVVRRHRAADRAMIWSFHRDAVATARAVLPEAPAAQLWGGRTGDAASLIEGTVQRGAQAISVQYSAVEPALVHAARLRGLTVYTWTVDQPSDQARVAAAGVAGICTNLPDVLRETLTTEQYAGTYRATTVG
ncbi:MAG: glycerophosphodiester phosphodiesterase [Dehalococcoidia bacterium]